MRKNDLVALRAEMLRAERAIDAIEKTDAFWESQDGEIPDSLPEVGALRRSMFNLTQTINVAKRLPNEKAR